MADFKKLDEKINSAVKWLEAETASLRAGRAHPALLEDVKVDAYGTVNPLKNVASISVADAKTLVVEPWDKSLLEPIEKAIFSSNSGVRPVTSKDSIRVILPELTQERRNQLIKLLSEKLEEARISIRQGRDETWKEIQDKEREKEISKDEKFRLKDQMEEKVKTGISRLDKVAESKEKEISE